MRLGLALGLALAWLATVACGGEAGRGGAGGGDEGGGAPQGCPPGERSLDDGRCQAPGIPEDACATGFAPTGDGACAAILPAEICPSGTIAIPGDTACREIAPCGDTPWGAATKSSATQYVDAGYTGSDADGSEARPWPTVQAGVDAATPNAVVAIAAGSYAEDVLVQGKPVTLWGRCPAMVELTGVAGPGVVAIAPSADGTRLHDLAIRGGAIGVIIDSATDVVLERLWIHGTSDRAINVQDNADLASATVRDVLIEDVTGLGIFSGGSSLIVTRTAIRGVEPYANGTFGQAVSLLVSPPTQRPATLLFMESLVRTSHEVAVRVSGSRADIDGVLVRDTRPQPTSGNAGWGINYQADNNSGLPSSGTIRRTVVEQSHEIGIAVLDSAVTIEDSVVRDTYADVAGLQARGVNLDSRSLEGQASATIRHSVVERTEEIGVFAMAAAMTLESVLVRDSLPRPSDAWFGRGINVQDHPDTGERASLSMTWSAVEGSHDVGLHVIGSEAVVSESRIRNTRARQSDGAFGDGVVVQSYANPGRATVTHSLLQRSDRAGLATFGGELELGDTVIDCAAFHLNGESQAGMDALFVDLGGNACTCGDEVFQCQVLSSSLEPPQPAAP